MKTLRRTMVRSYELPCDMTRPVYWFNDMFEAGTWTDAHRHDKWGEVAFVASGHMVLCTKHGNHLIPARQIAWIPAGLEHEWYVANTTNDRSLYIMPHVLNPSMQPDQYRLFHVTPLVRELILALENIASSYNEGQESRLVQTLLDQLSTLKEVETRISLPEDRRLLFMCTSLLDNPDTTRTIEEWATELGMSTRHLARYFKQQTGENLGTWRQRLRMQFAIDYLNAGQSVTDVAFNCGYTSVSAFIITFRKYFGLTPGSYLAKKGSHQ